MIVVLRLQGRKVSAPAEPWTALPSGPGKSICLEVSCHLLQLDMVKRQD